MKSRRRRALLITAIVLLLPMLYVTAEHLLGKQALKRWELKQRRAGRPLDIEALRPPPVPRQSNAEPQFILASGRLQASQDIRRLSPVAMRFIAAGKAVPSCLLTNWVVKTRGPAATKNPGSFSDRTNLNWIELAQELEKIQEHLQETRASLQSGVLDFGLNYHQGLSIRMYHLPRLKSAAIFLSIAARSALHQGDLPAAADNLSALVALTRNLQDERIVMSQLFRISLGNIAAAATWEALQVPHWNDTQLAALQAQWRSVEFLSAVVPAIEMERAAVRVEYDRARKSRDAAQRFLSAELWGNPNPAPAPISTLSGALQYAFQHPDALARRGIYEPLWQFGWSYADEVNYIRNTDLLIDAAGQTARDKSQRAFRQAEQIFENNETNRSFGRRIRLTLSPLLTSGFFNTFSKAIDAETQKELIIAAIAITRYRQRHGKLPESLDVLVPDILATLPRDYGDGAVIRYRPGSEGAFVLYSVGRNGTDEHGDPAPLHPGENSFHYLRGRDVVWPVAASPEEIAASSRKPL